MLTIEGAFEQISESFNRLSPEQQEAVRKEIYEKVTGQPYR